MQAHRRPPLANSGWESADDMLRCRAIDADLLARGLRRPAQKIGRQVEIVFDAFGDDAALADLDPGYPRQADAGRLAPELQSFRPRVHGTAQHEGHVRPADGSHAGEPRAYAIEILVQRPARKTADVRIVQTVVRDGGGENLHEVRLGPAFDVAIKQRTPDGFPVAATSDVAGMADAANMERRAKPRERLQEHCGARHGTSSWRHVRHPLPSAASGPWAQPRSVQLT